MHTDTTVLLTLADDVNLFHTRNGQTYGTMVVEAHRETWPLESASFQRWLR